MGLNIDNADYAYASLADAAAMLNGDSLTAELWHACQNNDLPRVRQLLHGHEESESNENVNEQSSLVKLPHVDESRPKREEWSHFSAKGSRTNLQQVENGYHTQSRDTASNGQDSTAKFIQQRLREEMADPSKPDATGRVALHYCAKDASQELIQDVLDADPSVIDRRDNDGFTPLNYAVIWGNKEACETLLNRGSDANNLDTEKHSLVHWATVCANKDVLHLLLSKEALPSTPDIIGAHALHYATQLGSKQEQHALTVIIFSLLLRNGANPNGTDFDERTPLHWAACSGSLNAAQLLVQGGANKAPVDKDLLTPLHCAAAYGHDQIIEFLLDSGTAVVDVNAQDRNGSTPLFYAVAMGHSNCVKLLLDKNADPNWQDRKKRTAAHCGASKAQLKALKLLHQYGGSFSLESNRGDIPLHEAVQTGAKEVIMWLLDVNPSVLDSYNHSGRTALHIAAATGNLDLTGLLVARGASMNTLMFTHKHKLTTPLDLALQKDQTEIIEFLRKSGGKHAFELPPEILLAAEAAFKENTNFPRREAVRSVMAESYAQTDDMRLDLAPLDSTRPLVGGSERLPSKKKKKKNKMKLKGQDDLALLESRRSKEDKETGELSDGALEESSNTISTLKQSFSEESAMKKFAENNASNLSQYSGAKESSRDCPACKAKTETGSTGGLAHNHRKPGRSKNRSLDKQHKRLKRAVSDSVNSFQSAPINMDAEARLRDAYLRMALDNAAAAPYPGHSYSAMTPAKRYAEEKRIFQELAQIKRLQIQYGNVQEEVLVRRAADNFSGGKGVRPGEFQFNTFAAWEKYLYDQLKHLYLDEAAKLNRIRPRSAGLFEQKLSYLPKIRNEDRVDQLMKVYGVAPLPLQFPKVQSRAPSTRSSRPPWHY